MRKIRYSLNQLINILKDIYSKEGIVGLISTNLYDNYELEFCIRKYKKDDNYTKKNKRGYPDEWCCQKINILEERKEYLKNKFPIETDTFEELCELHIRPFLDGLIKNITINGFILDMGTFTSNNRCNIRTSLKKHKKNIKQVRKYFDLSTDMKESLRKDSDGYYQTRNSYAEVVWDNFLILYTETSERVKWEEPYPQDFVEKYKINAKSDCTILPENINDKIILIEIWRFNPHNNRHIGNKNQERIDYLKRRKIKEDYWKTREDIIFIGIENENLYCNQCEINAVSEC